MVALSPFVALRPGDDVVARTVDGALRAGPRAARRRTHVHHAAWLEAWDDAPVAAVDEWIDAGVLLADDRPRLRLVEQRLVDGGVVLGILGCVRLSDLVPHERTDPAAVRRRVLRDRRQEVEIRPLLAVLPTDPPGLLEVVHRVAGAPPETDVVDELGVRHRVWPCPDDDARSLSSLLAPLPCLLADGHHRAAAASTSGRTDAMALLALASAPPRLLPVWRVAAVPPGHDQAVDAWIDRLPRGDDVVVHHAGRRAAVGGDGLELPVETSQRLAQTVPGVARVTTTADPTVVAVAERDGAVVVAAPAPSVTDVLSAVAAGRPLPPKSTAFDPKPRVGLVMRRL